MDDRAYLSLEWFQENETCFIVPYIEQNFRPVSYQHEFDLMRRFLFFTKSVIEDFKMSNEEKQLELLHEFTYGKSKIAIIVGSRGCMPKGTLVQTSKGLIPIEKVNDVLSYNFENGIVESKPTESFYTGKKRVYKIHTPHGIIKCSSSHKWIIERKGKIMEVETSEINPDTDVLLKV